MKREDENIEVIIDSAELTEFVYTELTDMGYALTGDEAFDIADVFMEFFLQKFFMERVEDNED